MASATIKIATEVLDHDHGHWCMTCLLATGVRVMVVTRAGEQMPRLHQVLLCPNCGGRAVVVDREPRRC